PAHRRDGPRRRSRSRRRHQPRHGAHRNRCWRRRAGRRHCDLRQGPGGLRRKHQAPAWRGNQTMSLANVYYGSALYHLSLWARPPAGLAIAWDRRWPGDAARGAELQAGEFRFAGELVRSRLPPWDAVGVRPEYLAKLHGFGWLDQCDDWSEIAWRPDVLAERLAAWTEHFTSIARDDEFRRRLIASYTRQAHHLNRVAAKSAPGLPRLGA